jgi:signal transduction histidine kinase
MDANHLAAEYCTRHRDTHARFVAQVQEWLRTRARHDALQPRQLLEYLANWLIFHILGDDRSLGRQVAAIQRGVPAQEAYTSDRASDDPRTEILLGALRRLYGGLMERNEMLVAAQESLARLNASLEERVALRTAELAEANQRLKQEQQATLEAEKMASLGRMVAGFAHELNTPVGVAVGAASQTRDLLAALGTMLAGDEVSEEDISEQLGVLDETSELTLDNLRRAAGMVQSFKRTAVDQTSEAEREFDLCEVIEDVEKALHGEFKHTAIRIETSCPPGLNLYGPPGVLVQLLSNLMQNARIHAFADGTRPGRIRIDVTQIPERIRIVFADDGVGMNPDTLARVFEPFYTTRRGSGGSGLGLYIAYNLVTRGLGGTIACDSSTGKGTRFVIEFPRHAAATERRQG